MASSYPYNEVNKAGFAKNIAALEREVLNCVTSHNPRVQEDTTQSSYIPTANRAMVALPKTFHSSDIYSIDM